MNEAQQPEPVSSPASDVPEPNLSPEVRQETMCNGIMAGTPPAQTDDAQAATPWGSTIEYPDLPLTTKAHIFGDPNPASIEPDLTAEQREQVMVDGDYCCIYCGYQSGHNHVHNRNDNHKDIRPENLAVVDPICHASLHLGELAPGAATLAWLPGLSRRDLNHLQRTILIALRSQDKDMQARAKDLLGWLQIHSDFVSGSFGTNMPAVFGKAITRIKDENAKEMLQKKLRNVAVVFNPEKMPISEEAINDMAQETLKEHPCSVQEWERVLHYLITDPDKQPQGEANGIHG